MLFINRDEVKQLLGAKEYIDVLKIAYLEQAHGRAINQPRMDTEVPIHREGLRDARYEFKTMVGVVPKLGITALRLSSKIHNFPIVDGEIRDVSLPLASGHQTIDLVILFSFESTEPLALFPIGPVDGLRVACVSAIAADQLARSDSNIIGILGSSNQAAGHLEAMSSVRKLEEVRVFSPNMKHSQKFAKELGEKLGTRITPVDEPEKAIMNSDIAVAATNSKVPVLKGKWLKQGSHFTCVTYYEPDEEAIQKADVSVIHTREKWLTRVAGEGHYGRSYIGEPATHISWEKHILSHLDFQNAPLLDEVLAGKVQGRTDPKQITFFFNNQGLGIQFAAIGAKILEVAKKKGIGREIPTDWFTGIPDQSS